MTARMLLVMMLIIMAMLMGMFLGPVLVVMPIVGMSLFFMLMFVFFVRRGYSS
jgi:hypothetical protein